MSIELALADAARNCKRESAKATVTLRSGVQITGSLEAQSGADLGTRLLHTDGGWVTVRVDEVAAVESHR
ncbi:MAG: hypothetical protein QOF36_2524 [Microbacteriaceae bacterium]|jgi:hypothetical protein|nr:hypothetical protein [Microbacteriaceae bacterium]